MWLMAHVLPIKVKGTLVQALRLCTGLRPTGRVERGIALLFHDHGTRRGWRVKVTPRPLFTPRKDLVPTVQEAGWATGPVWTGTENLVPTGIRFPDRPARGQSLYRLRYPAHIVVPMRNRNAHRISGWKPVGKRLLGIPRRRWAHNIKTDLTKIRWESTVLT